MGQDDCIFCRIASGEIPTACVFEDDSSIAFLDAGPLADGHILLIPKVHASTVDQMSADQAGAVLRNLPNLARAVQEVTGCEGVNILQNNGRVAHQTVMHVHFHIIPRSTGDSFNFNWPAGEYAPSRAEELAGLIRSAAEQQ